MAHIFLVTPSDPFHSVVGAAFGSFTTRQNVGTDPLPVIQGGTVNLGMKVYIHANGEFSTTATPTLSLGVWFGTQGGTITNQFEFTAVTTASGAAALPWIIDFWGLFTGTLGTATTLVGQGYCMFGTTQTAFGTTPLPIPSTAALRTVTNFDATIARAFGVCATYSASSASNTVRTNNLSMNLIN
jgi:hypothetical protein